MHWSNGRFLKLKVIFFIAQKNLPYFVKSKKSTFSLFRLVTFNAVLQRWSYFFIIKK